MKMNFSVLPGLFIIIPAVELAVLLKARDAFGWMNTIALIVFTGIAGAALAKWQGLQTIALISRDISEGRMPAPRLFDALLIIVAGAFLLTPGFITDAVGFFLLIPAARNLTKKWLQRKLEAKFSRDIFDIDI